MAIDPENPFVGPRPLEVRDGIYGRDEEIRELLWLFTAERVVWLHSPSGAGKTSLVQAGLIPRLAADDFEILPTIRVNRRVEEPGNRYENSVRSCLGAKAGLYNFLNGSAIDKSRVLIFDQFEEILTLDSGDTEAKKAFFEAMGRALRLPDIWALFIVREDFLPALDPYVRFIPTLMNHRFRLDLLAIDNAKEAMTQIAAKGGRGFNPDASSRLASELAKVLVPSADGQDWKPGKFIEPVILQVVCRNMWEEMPAGEKIIQTDHVPTGGKVAKALSAYYANCVKSVSATPGQEQTVRTWIGEKLIVSGMRNQVLDAVGDGAGLGANIAAALVEIHLIRREDRGDRTWYELAHDRLVEPILEDNRRWMDEHLYWVQRRADLWRLQSRPKAILLVDEDLKNAERWIQESTPQLTPVELEFLSQSREEQKVRNKIRRWTTFAWVAAGVATVLFLTATLFYLRARSRELINLARAESRVDQLSCAVQDASEALALSTYLGSNQTRAGMEALSEVLQGGAGIEEADEGDLRIAFTVATSDLAIAEDQKVSLYRIPSRDVRYSWVVGCGVTRLGLTSDGKKIAFGLSNGESVRADIPGAGAGGSSEIACAGANDAVEALAFSQMGALGSASAHGIKIDGRPISQVDTTALAFHPDGNLLAAGLRDGTVLILDLNGNQRTQVTKLKTKVTGIAWGRSHLAVVSLEDGGVEVWDANGKVKQQTINASSIGVTAVALNPDESLLAIAGAGADHQTKVWDLRSNSPPLVLRATPAMEAKLTDVGFLDNTRLLVADSKGFVRLYPLDAGGLQQSASEFLGKEPCKRAP